MSADSPPRVCADCALPPAPRGWVFYDGNCSLCAGGAVRWGGLFARRGYCWVPLQTPGLAAHLGIPEDELRREMKLLTTDGQLLGGVDAWIHLLCAVWWLRPVSKLLQLPGIYHLGRGVYRWVARHRSCWFWPRQSGRATMK